MSGYKEIEYNKPFDPNQWKKVEPFVKPYYKGLIQILLITILASGADILYPLFSRYALNHFVAYKTTDGIWSFVGLYALIIAVQTILIVVSSKMAMLVEMSIGRDLKRAVFTKLQTLSFSYYNKTPVGYILARTIGDTNRMAAIVSWTIMYLMTSFIYIAGAFISMSFLNLKLALLVMTIIPAISIITLYFQRKLLDANREIRKVNSNIVGQYNEGIMGAKTSKTLSIEHKNYDEFTVTTSELTKANQRHARLEGIYIPLITLCSSVAVAIVLQSGGNLVVSEVMELATFSTFITYAVGIFNPIQDFAKQITNIIATQASVERVFDLLETETEVTDTKEVIEKYGDYFNPKTENWEDIKGDIQFENVWFKYPDGGDYILENFNLSIPFGTTVAIVGETGAGKSTLVNLACRFFEPTKGKILIDNKDYKERSVLWMHRNIGYVPQTPHLFSGTIKENIMYGAPNATDEDIEKAVKLSKADTVIKKLAKGYEETVGESGDRLSTGEKQLISFARAIVANAPILVLDEATSSIDTQTEHLIQEAIETVLDGRTAFIIAHRLSTIRMADLILVVEKGRIIEQGTHNELLSKKGHYFNLYSRQFQEEAFARVMESDI